MRVSQTQAPSRDRVQTTTMAKMHKILVVDDELKIARLVRDYLTEAGFEVVLASNGPAAVATARSEKPDLVVLDLGLPGMDGHDVTRSIRRQSEVPIVMLTARSDETDRVIGLELGADDYVVKPFSPKELVARIKAVLRRSAGAVRSEVVRIHDLEINVGNYTVHKGNTRLDFTVSEFELLRTLAGQPGRVFTRAQLLEAIRGVAFESYERAIDAHIKNIRKKLNSVDPDADYIETVYGVGYRFNDA